MNAPRGRDREKTLDKQITRVVALKGSIAIPMLVSIRNEVTFRSKEATKTKKVSSNHKCLLVVQIKIIQIFPQN